jgi:hypothetical protein
MIKIPGLDVSKKYRISYPDEKDGTDSAFELSGLTLQNAGISVKRDWGDFQAKLIYIQGI